jgi:hypothetical protein
MRERPIIFNGEMVRAILGGRKSQTRRAINPQPNGHLLGFVERPLHNERETPVLRALFKGDYAGTAFREFTCPYGKVGDHLWVRETFALMCKQADPFCWCETEEQRRQNHYYEYRADTGNPYPGQWDADDAKGNDEAPKWKPAIHMPRAASRITLEIVSVRVERVRDISLDDAEAEGINVFDATRRNGDVLEFAKLWDKINARRGYSWESNSWVWVITFSRTTGGTNGYATRNSTRA